MVPVEPARATASAALAASTASAVALVVTRRVPQPL